MRVEQLLDHATDIGGAVPALVAREQQQRADEITALLFGTLDALQSLNPTLRVGFQVGEPIALHRRGTGTGLRGRVLDLMRAVGMARPEQTVRAWPHQLSGGMQQRVGLARAFATEAPILLMDEPFSALDPLIRARLQDELLELQAKTRRTIIFVSHDLDEAFKLGNRIALMEGGRIVQIGTAREIIANPVNEYVADFVAHMNPLGVLTAADVVQPGDAPGDPVPRDMPVREVMGLLSGRTALPVQGGGCITRDAVLARLIDPRG